MIEREGFKRSLDETEVKELHVLLEMIERDLAVLRKTFGGTTMITCQQGTTPDWLKMEDGINNGLADPKIEVIYLAEGRGRDR